MVDGRDLGYAAGGVASGIALGYVVARLTYPVMGTAPAGVLTLGSLAAAAVAGYLWEPAFGLGVGSYAASVTGLAALSTLAGPAQIHDGEQSELGRIVAAAR